MNILKTTTINFLQGLMVVLGALSGILLLVILITVLRMLAEHETDILGNFKILVYLIGSIVSGFLSCLVFAWTESLRKPN